MSSHSDCLSITGLCIPARIGVHAWEQAIQQNLFIDIQIPCQTHHYADDISHALDYSVLAEQVSAFVTSRSFQLIETVANEVANLIQKKFNISALNITVHKPSALKNASDVSIRITR
ncbi:MAG: dihydroneopterin aldolase [Legionellaceae bacterium]|nr:dihydroneopterin aldolase [Legionellaceae bacterium]